MQRNQKRHADAKDGKRNQKVRVGDDGACALEKSHALLTLAGEGRLRKREKEGSFQSCDLRALMARYDKS
jgi:hypothetical protein